jgi:hypothetical protein
MFDEITTNQLPTDLDWEDVGEAPNTLLGVTVTMWGITFYVDAIAIDESGEALCPSGARLLKLVREIDDYEVGAFYERRQSARLTFSRPRVSHASRCAVLTSSPRPLRDFCGLVLRIRPACRELGPKKDPRQCAESRHGRDRRHAQCPLFRL